jgi:ParB family chromosome partitioning protein
LSFDEVLDRMTQAVEKLNVDRIRVEDLAKSGGAPED